MVRSFTAVLAATSTLALAGCIFDGGGGGGGAAPGGGGGGGGAPGGGGGGGGPAPTFSSDAAYNDRYDAQPVTGFAGVGNTFSGDFDGEVQAQVQTVDLGSGGIQDRGYVVGDLDVSIDWTDGQTGNAITGTASGFDGNIDGDDVTFTGTLTASDSAQGAGASSGPGIRQITFQELSDQTGQPIPQGVDPSDTITLVGIALDGTLNEGDIGDVDANLILSGNVSGTGDTIRGLTTTGSVSFDGGMAIVAGPDSNWYLVRR